MVVSPTIVAIRTEFFRELAQPARLAILEALREGPLLIAGLVSVTDLDQLFTSFGRQGVPDVKGTSDVIAMHFDISSQCGN